MHLQRILVAVNSPDGRDAAFARALALARSSGAELYVLHAVPVNQPFAFRAAERLASMGDLRKRAEDAGVAVQTVEQHGDPAEIIQLHANSRAVDLIVMGGEPRRWWRMRRSVAERVIRRTSVPTLVVASDTPDETSAFRHVFVAVDLSPASKNVVDGAVALTAGEAEQMTVMHTVPDVEAAGAVQPPGWWLVPELRTHVVEDARKALEAIVSEVPADVDTRVHVLTGPAAGAILEHSADAGADVVVVGRSQGFKILGSTALRVLRRNERTLLVIPGLDRRSLADQRAA
jgi:nucleotide-binding universal stress UspA family protein